MDETTENAENQEPSNVAESEDNNTQPQLALNTMNDNANNENQESINAAETEDNNEEPHLALRALSMEKVRSAVLLLSGLSLHKLDETEDKSDIKSVQEEDGLEMAISRMSVAALMAQRKKRPKRQPIEPASSKEAPAVVDSVNLPSSADLVEYFEPEESSEEEEPPEDVDPMSVGKGICFQLAEEPGKICRRGICEPSAPIKKKKSKSGAHEQILKKICRRENERMLTCLNRPPDSKCKTITETTILTPSKSAEGSSIMALKATELGAAAAAAAGSKEKTAVTFEPGIEENEGKTGEEGKDDDLFEAEVEVCECCKCVICTCPPKFVTRLMTEEEMNRRNIKGLEARKKLKMIYSWDTVKIPSDWDFSKEQLLAQDEERESLIKQGLELEELRAKALAELQARERKEQEEEYMLEDKAERAARRSARENEDDWASYKAMEWAGLRHQYTTGAKRLVPETLDEISNTSWTSQPPPRMILGTISPYLTRDSTASSPELSVQLGPIQERSRSFLRLHKRGVTVKRDKKEEEMKRRYKEEQKERKRRAKKEREEKRAKMLAELSASAPELSKTPGSLSAEDIDESESESSGDEEKRDYFEGYIPDDIQKDGEKYKKKSSKVVYSKQIEGKDSRATSAYRDIVESDLPMGLRREIEKFRRKPEKETQDSIQSSIKSLPPAAAARLAELQSLGSDMHYTKSCPCLPGYCVCDGKPHWTFQKPKPPPDLLQFATDEYKHRTLAAQEGHVPKTDSELKAAGVYVWKSYECPCVHSDDDVHPSPEESEEGRVPRLPLRKMSEEDYICTCRRRYEQTLVIIKPDAMIFKDVVKRALVHVGGLNIVNERTIRLSPEQVSDIYADTYYGSPFFPLFVLQLSRYPILALSVSGINAVSVVRDLVGEDRLIPESWFFPESIKRKIGIFHDIREAVHVSENSEAAAVENRYFFPQTLIEPIPTFPHRVSDYCVKHVNPILTKGLAKVAKMRPVDPIIYLAEWLLTHNPYQPWFKPQHINLAPT